MSKYFPEIEIWKIPEKIILASFDELSKDGKLGQEGVVLWLGKSDRNVGLVKQVVLFRCSGVNREPHRLMIEPNVLAKVTDFCVENEVRLLGQIHSHGPSCTTNLSWVDITYGIRSPHLLSVVAPDYGLKGAGSWAECGVHIFESQNGFRRMDKKEVKKRIQIVPRMKASSILIEEN